LVQAVLTAIAAAVGWIAGWAGVAGHVLTALSWIGLGALRKAAADARPVLDGALAQVSPSAPPFFVLHGSNDSMIPVEQAREFVRLLRAASARPVVYAELPRAQHAFDVLGSVRARHAVAAVGDFLGVLYGDYRRGRTDVSAEQLDGEQLKGEQLKAEQLKGEPQGSLPKQVSQ
jgi:dienelactone hydrolase